MIECTPHRACSSMAEQRPFKPFVESSSLSTLIKNPASSHFGAENRGFLPGNRRFIIVQLPEPTGNQQFSTIAEIGKERIRRVIACMKKEREDQLALDKPEDLGFKVFKLAPSNYKQWQGDLSGLQDPTGLVHQAELFADPLVEAGNPRTCSTKWP